MRKVLLAIALVATGASLSGCWHGHGRGWGDQAPGRGGDHGNGGHGDHGNGDGGH
jgi:hypothetical protein